MVCRRAGGPLISGRLPGSLSVISGQAHPENTKGERPLTQITLTVALSHYDHVIDLFLGNVRVEGVRLNMMKLPLHDIFQRTVGFTDFDVAEMSMAKYVSMRSQGDDRVFALPVFLSRVARHSAIYVRRDRIRSAGDFAGKRIGVPEWAQTAAVYARGVLQHEIGVPLTRVQWVQAGLGEPGRAEKVPLKLPAGLELTPVADRSLSQMLDDGSLDAVIAADAPACFGKNPEVVRYFERPTDIEMDYARRTGIFPIMHTVVVRRTLLDANPWLAGNLFNAFTESLRRSMTRITDRGATAVPLPWLTDAVDRAREVLGPNFWPYGIEGSRRTLEAFLGFAHEQGVCHRLLSPEEIFPPQTHRAVRV